MKSITKLKDEARKHEQKEEWEKAIKAYLQVLEAGDDVESGELELPLFNRVGDLYVRLGRSKDAVHYYEQAADHYAEAGLFNNAIALCNKALRYMPGHMELLRKLGQFSASQGFLTDARRYFLEYADKKFAAGETDAALKALAAFADAAEDDAEVRELLGRKLHVHGRPVDAVHELKRAYEMRVKAAEGMAADALRAEILAIDPGAFADEPPPTYSPPSALAEAGAAEPEPVEVHPVEGLATPAQELEPEAEEEHRIELPELDHGLAEDVEGVEASQLEGFETTVFDGFDDVPESGLLAGLETSSEFEAPSEITGIDTSGLERPDQAEPFDLPHLETTAYEESTGMPEEEAAFDLPTLETSYEEEEPSSSFDLPLLGEDEPEEDEEPGPPLPMLEPFPSLEEPEAAEAAEPEPATARTDAVQEEPAAPEPEEPAEQTGWDPSQLPPAPPAPAAPPAAAVVPPASAGAPQGGFVDLGSLLNDEPEKGTDTRFVVQEKPPSGDEDRDFAELLSQFKQKVAEHVSAEDAAAHYDLGLAFKEMGLIDEAISEFQIALRAGDMRLKVYEELGQCFLAKQQYNIAEKVLKRAAESKYDDELELIGVYYHLGRAYEAMGRREQARDAYERVLGLDINFGDVAARLARL